MSIEDAVKEAYASVDSILLHSIELNHSGFTNPIRVVNNNEDVYATLESEAPYNANESVKFVACGFELTLPSIDKNKLPELVIKIDNIYLPDEHKRISDYGVDALDTFDNVSLIYRMFNGKDEVLTPLELPYHLTLYGVSADLYTVQAKAKFFNAENEEFPKNIYSLKEFPTLMQ